MLITVVSRWWSYEAASKRITPGIDQVSNVLQERRTALHWPSFEQSQEQKCYSTWTMGTHCYRGYVIWISCYLLFQYWIDQICMFMFMLICHSYYMASSINRLCEPNLVPWLPSPPPATPVMEKMGLYTNQAC